jgi:hypothetical protein
VARLPLAATRIARRDAIAIVSGMGREAIRSLTVGLNRLDRSNHPEVLDRSRASNKCYLFDLRPDFLERFFAPFFGGTFFPSRLASDNPIAIACLRLLTLRPDRPLFKVPALRFFIVRLTLADAFFEYLRAMTLLPIV